MRKEANKTKKKVMLGFFFVTTVAILLVVLSLRFSGSEKQNDEVTGEGTQVVLANSMQSAASKTGNKSGSYFGPMGNWSEKKEDGYVNPASNQVSHSSLQNGSESVGMGIVSESSLSGSGNAAALVDPDLSQQTHGSWVE